MSQTIQFIQEILYISREARGWMPRTLTQQLYLVKRKGRTRNGENNRYGVGVIEIDVI